MNRRGCIFANPTIIILVSICYFSVASLLSFNATASSSSVHLSSNFQKKIIIIITHSAENDEIEATKISISSQLSDVDVEISFHYFDENLLVIEDLDKRAIELMKAQKADAAFIIISVARLALRIVVDKGNSIEVTTRTGDASPGTALRESVSVIIRAAVVALLDELEKKSSEVGNESSSIESSSDNNAASVLLPTSAQSRERSKKTKKANKSKRFFAEAGFAIGYYTKGLPPWIAMETMIGWRPFSQFYLNLGYTAFAEMSNTVRDLTLTIKRHPINVGAGYLRFYNRLVVGGNLDIVIDYATEKLSSKTEDFILNPKSSEVHSGLNVILHIGVQLFAAINLYFKLGVQIPISGNKYGISTVEGELILIEPLPVQPFAVLGLRFYFF